MSDKILVIGASGMLGHKLMQQLGAQFTVAGTLRGQSNPYKALENKSLFYNVDIYNLATIEDVLNEFKPTVVINCIGIIKQLEESKSAEPTIHTNSLFPHQLARLCSESGAKLLHISTDCVFSGNKGNPYIETDESDAKDLYGKSKFMGEVTTAPHLTLRTSIIGHELRGNKSLVEWVMSQKNCDVNGFTRALYTGLTTLELSKVVMNVIQNHKDLTGLYHVSVDEISKYDLIDMMNKVYNLGITLHKQDEFYCDRRLDSQAFRNAIGYTPPPWRQLIEEMATDYQNG